MTQTSHIYVDGLCLHSSLPHVYFKSEHAHLQ